MPDFVAIDTAIPQAKACDYAEHILVCLADASGPDASGKSTTRSLSRAAADGSRVLFVAFTLQVMNKAIALEYTFSLAPMPLEKVDLLASRIAGVEREAETCANREDDSADVTYGRPGTEARRGVE